MKTLLMLTNATPQTGAGHAMRCAALADAWRAARLGPVAFMGEIGIPFALERLRDARIPIVERVPPERQERLVVLADSYDETVWQRGARVNCALRVFTSDIPQNIPAGYGVVWNPNAYGTPAMYDGFAGAVIAGRDYVPLREDLPTAERVSHDVGVTLGGATPSPKIVSALRHIQMTRNLSFAAVGDWAPAEWRRISPSNPWLELAGCRTVISAASVTVWEASAVGVPVVVLQTQDHQRLVAGYAIANGVQCVNALGFGDYMSLAGALDHALERARPAPKLVNGAPSVARELYSRSGQSP